MGHRSCCVVNCKNNEQNSSCKFYKFPAAISKLDQRKKWIASVTKINSEQWKPKNADVICSDHFIGKKKTFEEISPGYIPTVFSFMTPNPAKPNEANEAAIINRHSRFMKRRLALLHQELKSKKSSKKPKPSLFQSNNMMFSDTDVFHEDSVFGNTLDSQDYVPEYVDKSTEANIFIDCSEPEKSFTCNRYITNNSKCDAEVQTDIVTVNYQSVILNPRKAKNKSCGTTPKTFVDQAVGSDNGQINAERSFKGFMSVKENEQFLDLAGVTFNNFEFLLKRFNANCEHNCKVYKENRLLIFLMKMKTGLTFAAISVLFNVHRTTVSSIFFSVLQQLAKRTADLVFWPQKDIVEGTMPECFYPDYKNTRVIIDCTEFKIETPSTVVDQRVFTYSHYKKGFTAKLLVGITPGGFISFKSAVAGGRKSDTQITIESGLLDLLEDGDVVLADKGFPTISRTLDDKGKNVLVVLPPFLEKKEEFTKEETQSTYNIAKVRIHVERIMQRLRTHQILNKIPQYLFSSIDDIVHVCCVLVNLQPPIIAEKQDICN